MRTYISDVEGDFALGQRWRHNYEIKLEFDDQFAPDGRPLRALLTLGNGDYYQFDYRGTEYFPAPNVPGRLAVDGNSWRFTDEDDFVYRFNADGVVQSIKDRSGVANTMSYDADGFLTRVTDDFGRFLSFEYNEDGRLETLIDAQSRPTHYSYNLKGRLELVTLADLKTRKYAYTDPRNSKLLTGITDERNIQLGSIHYNFEGRVDESSFAGGAEHHLFRYADTATVITDALGTERRVEYVDINGELFQAKVSAPCSSCSAGGTAETTYNSAGYRTKTIDFRGNITTFSYNARGLLESQTEASGKPEARTTSTQWHSDFRLPIKITEPILGGSRITDLGYAPNGTLLTRKVTAPNAAGLSESRIWTFTYNNFGQVLTEDGPRTDVNDLTTYSYNPDGTRASMTDALGHTTNYTTHDASGKVLRMTDANGLATEYVYDLRDRLTDAKVKANATATVVETTHYDYTATGSLDKLTLPDGSFLSYQYDDADRLVGVSDNLGNSVSYTLNAAGDRTAEVTKDVNNVLAMTMSRAIDPLGRVQSVTGANIDEISSYTYDGNGNEKTASSC